MVFSKEDKLAWEKSEVMLELEKIADQVLNPDSEAYEPIKTGEDSEWEEEPEEIAEENDKTSIEELDESNPFKKEMYTIFNNRLVKNLSSIASNMGEKSKIKIAYVIEETINKLNDLFREDKND